EAGDRGDLRRVAARLDQPLETADVGLGDLPVALEREDQSHVDVLAARDHLFDGGQALSGGRNLHVQVRPIDLRVQPPRLGDRRLRIAGEVRVDLDRDVTVFAAACVPDGT